MGDRDFFSLPSGPYSRTLNISSRLGWEVRSFKSVNAQFLRCSINCLSRLLRAGCAADGWNGATMTPSIEEPLESDSNGLDKSSCIRLKRASPGPSRLRLEIAPEPFGPENSIFSGSGPANATPESRPAIATTAMTAKRLLLENEKCIL